MATTKKSTTAKTTTTTAKTATAKKGTAMTTDAKKLTKEEKKAAALAATRAEIDELKKKYDAPAFENPVNVHNILKAEALGKEPVGLFVSDLDLELLVWKANELGWTTNGFMTKNQVAVCHGTIPEDAKSIVLHAPSGFPATYYNVDEIEWENGEPTYDDGIRKEQGRIRRAARAKKRANVQKLGLPNGTLMPVDINDKRAMKAYLDACAAISAAMSA